MPLNPMEQVRSDRPWTDTRDLSALRAHGAPMAPAPASMTPTPAPLIQATGWRRNAKGQVELYAETQPASGTAIAGVTCTVSHQSP